jgi:hypothetical protein
MTKEQLQAKILEYQAQKEQALAVANACQGAMEAIAWMIAQMDKPDEHD